MSDSSPPIEVLTIQDLLGLVELQGIEVYELRGRGIDRADAAEFEEGYAISAAVNAAPDQIKTRFMLTFSAVNGESYVDMAVRYALAVPASVPQAISVEFAERVGIMAAFPFLREHVYNLASRLGHSIPVLGLIQQGQFTLTPDGPTATG